MRYITKTNHLREQLIPSLSGGERQRLDCYGATQPKLLVLDGTNNVFRY